MSDPSFDVLIVGAGHAGVQTVAELRAGSFDGTIAIISDEKVLPYEKPPLTKGFLSGSISDVELLIRPAEFWESSNLQLILDERVTKVDSAGHVVETAKGRRYYYRTLVWAAGASPVRLPLPGVELPAVHVLRSLADSIRFRDRIAPGIRVVVVGGGYVGLEAASACATLGAEVAIVEAQPRLLSRVAGQEIAEHILRAHQSAGVAVELGAHLNSISAAEGDAVRVGLVDGRTLPADVVLISVGIRPNDSVLTSAGAECGNGVEIDSCGRTSLPDVYAAGDCTSFPVGGGRRMRLESLQNAVEQGKLIAGSILGETADYSLVPFFWSHQYGLKIKTLGLFGGHDQAIVRRGAEADSLSVVYLRDGLVCAVDSINAMKDYVDAHKILGRRVDINRVADMSERLRDAVLAAELDLVMR